ncbi:MAG: sigma-70 family RNA polymerase sigma factor [Planctomycetes bacterium]|nr:sigma-70 family RNA polymerase sigma factor [Planctomycetota bacterium]
MRDDFGEIQELLRCGIQTARQKLLGDFFMRHRERLRWLVELRLNPRLRKRLDPSDVLQEAFLAASQRLEEYLQKPVLPLFLWLRLITGQKLLELHRQHLGAKSRDARREVPLEVQRLPEASSALIAASLIRQGATPDKGDRRAELREQVQAALEAMDPLDREVLVLRHFERLSNCEAARALGIREAAASKRHTRALKKLEEILRLLKWPPAGREQET